jgi:hypothetical protein
MTKAAGTPAAFFMRPGAGRAGFVTILTQIHSTLSFL